MRLAVVMLTSAAWLGSVAVTARAADVRAAWSTYLRAGPGPDFAVIDEVEHDQPMTVLGCRDKWCAVQYGRAAGYVDASALPGGGLPWPAEGAPTTACFAAGQQGYRGQEPTRFCHHR
jgi:uncharacterized protein YraI